MDVSAEGGNSPDSGLARRVRELSQEPLLAHPWEGLEEKLAEEGRDRLRLIGYGSLVNANSAAVTVTEEIARRALPVIAYGALRVFDYRMDPANSRYQGPDTPDALALLNLRLTGNPGDCFNGVVIETPLEHLPALRDRESDYSLARIAFRNWNESEIQSAWVLSCVEGTPGGELRLDRTLTPNRDYYRVCRDGAESFGTAFLDAWLDSAFLGDGKMRVREWERSEGVAE